MSFSLGKFHTRLIINQLAASIRLLHNCHEGPRIAAPGISRDITVRLLTVAQAYRLMNEGDEHLANADVGKASAAYRGAAKLVPDNHETVFWHAVTLVSAGREEEAMPLFAEAFKRWPRWRELVQRLPESGLLPDDQDLIRRIVAAR